MSLPRARPSVHMLSTSPVATDSANLEEDGSQGQAWIVPMTLGLFSHYRHGSASPWSGKKE